MALPDGPKFDGAYLFDSVRADSSHYSEGALYLLQYTPVIQRIHFNGEEGDRYVQKMGYPDRRWQFAGHMFASSYSALLTKLQAIEVYIRSFQDNTTATWAMVDSYGTSYSASQIHTCQYSPPHITINGYVCEVLVQGVVKGMVG